MPVAVYALSYKDTGSVLALCSLEKQAVVDQASANALRDRLVGDELAISMSTRGQPITIAAEDLVLDEVEVADPRALAGDPYAYQLAAVSDGPSRFGDGTPKQLVQPGNNVTLRLDADGTLTATTANDPQRINLYAILEGHSAIQVTLQVQSDVASFRFDERLTPNQAYAILFVGERLRTFVGLLGVEQGSEAS